MNTSFRLFVMMVLQLAIWGAWAPKIFPYMGMLGFEPWQQSLVGSSWGVAALVGIFFSNQFADRNFAAERFLAVSHLIGGLALVGTAFATDFWPFFACYLIFSLVYVPTLSVTNSIAFANLKDPAAGFGAVRMGGTVGWVLVSWPFVFLLGAHASVEQVRSAEYAYDGMTEIWLETPDDMRAIIAAVLDKPQAEAEAAWAIAARSRTMATKVLPRS